MNSPKYSNMSSTKNVKGKNRKGVPKKHARQPQLSESGTAVTLKKVYTEKLQVYTDGGCMGNGFAGSTGSYAFVVVEDEKVLHEYSRSVQEETTNNRMELQAITDAIQWLEEQGIEEPVRLFSDSEYCVKGLTRWIHGWRNKEFAGIKNPDMWLKLNELSIRNPQVQFTWVRGHGDNKWNCRADELCTAAL